jgi:hypothetical protein
VPVFTAAVDSHLNEKGRAGPGDAGDRRLERNTLAPPGFAGEMWRRKILASDFNALSKSRCRKRAINPAPDCRRIMPIVSGMEGS